MSKSTTTIRLIYAFVIVIGGLMFVPGKLEPLCLVCGATLSKVIAVSLVALGGLGMYAARNLANASR